MTKQVAVFFTLEKKSDLLFAQLSPEILKTFGVLTYSGKVPLILTRIQVVNE